MLVRLPQAKLQHRGTEFAGQVKTGLQVTHPVHKDKPIAETGPNETTDSESEEFHLSTASTIYTELNLLEVTNITLSTRY